ncbi:MAG TPA: T9SS type A sorting domain-containing protein [Flavobacterium sp.]
MKKKLLCLTLILMITSSYSQKELWGYRVVYNYLTPQSPGLNDGKIIKIPLDGLGENLVDPEVMHEFDVTGLQGKFPRGRLFQASNGKLYGVTGYDGYDSGQGIPQGVLFEYDLSINTYKVLSNALVTSNFAVIEPLPGMLYGLTNSGNSIFKYNINTEEMTIVASIPGAFADTGFWLPNFTGELMKASDGYVYGVASPVPISGTLWPAAIYRLNLQTNQVMLQYVFGIDAPVYTTKLVEGAPGKLYGAGTGGVNIGPSGVALSGSGTMFEYTIATNTSLKIFDFDYATIGAHPSPIIASGGKLYGGLFGNNVDSYPNAAGSLFTYDLAAQSMTLHSLTGNAAQIQHPLGMQLLATDGNIYGSYSSGIYQFNPATEAVSRVASIINAGYDLGQLIEICRKPSYHSFENSSFVVCPDNPFVFDLQNANAMTYVWRRGSAILASQTSGILDIANVTLADTGIYTCTMTNECGTTVTMPLQLTVENCLGLDNATALKNAIIIYPNPVGNSLNLDLSNSLNFEIRNISIINILGQRVYSTSERNLAVDVSSLKAGIYLLSITTDKGEWNGKFIKQ